MTLLFLFSLSAWQFVLLAVSGPRGRNVLTQAKATNSPGKKWPGTCQGRVCLKCYKIWGYPKILSIFSINTFQKSLSPSIFHNFVLLQATSLESPYIYLFIYCSAGEPPATTESDYGDRGPAQSARPTRTGPFGLTRERERGGDSRVYDMEPNYGAIQLITYWLMISCGDSNSNSDGIGLPVASKDDASNNNNIHLGGPGPPPMLMMMRNIVKLERKMSRRGEISSNRSR